jgi:hypothetical protein
LRGEEDENQTAPGSIQRRIEEEKRKTGVEDIVDLKARLPERA